MNSKQEQFCQFYASSSNASDAARQAGYSAKTASSIGERLLRNVEVQARIASLRNAAADRNKATIDNVVQEFCAIAFSDLTELYESTKGKFLVQDVKSLPENVRRAIASIAPVQTKDGVLYKVTLYDKVKALDSLSKYLGLFSEFNGAIATLKTYGIHLKQTDEGWVVQSEESK